MPAPTPSAADRVTGGTIALVNVRVVSMNPSDRKTTQKRRTVSISDCVASSGSGQIFVGAISIPSNP